jgi:hypothetical protein
MASSRLSGLAASLGSRLSLRRSAQGDRLCSACSKINAPGRDFEDLFQSSTDEPLMWQERVLLKHIQAHPNCPFCRMILKALPDKGLEGFADATGRVRLELGREEYWVDDRRGGLRHYVPRIGIQGNFHNTNWIQSLQNDWLVEERSDVLRGRIVDTSVDVSLLREWLRKCHEFHGSVCSASNQLRLPKPYNQREFRVIDVEKRCIVGVTECQYVTLSYVWGKDVSQLMLKSGSEQRLFGKGGLADHHTDIPTTIRDAITLTHLLGYRYLWIDALCIFQDDPEDQAKQIGTMQNIYANSEVTIVCASGEDSWAGLAGVGSRVRQQHVEDIHGLQLSNVLPNFERSIRKTTWITRAWTLQEMYFSRRLLYFTEQQIYFQCSKSSWREDQCLETPPFIQINMPEPATDFSPLLYKASQNLGGSQSQFENYCHTIHLYISRDLTVQDDILNAFSGVIKSYEAAMGYEFFWGVCTKFLINGLVFRIPDVSMSKPGIRRSGFPSWSWTGWLNNEGSKIFYPSWHLRFDCLSNWCRIQDDRYITLRKKSHRSFPGSPKDFAQFILSDEAFTSSEKDKALIFQASTTFMPFSFSEDQSIFGTTPLSLPLNPTREDWYLFVDAQRELERVEFVALTTYRGPSDNEDTVLIMAIKTDHRRVSERIYMAYRPVKLSYWMAYKPKWRTIFLV